MLVKNRQRQVMFVNPLTINTLSITKGGNRTSTNRERSLDLDKWFIIQRNIEMMKKKRDKVRIRERCIGS